MTIAQILPGTKKGTSRRLADEQLSDAAFFGCPSTIGVADGPPLRTGEE